MSEDGISQSCDEDSNHQNALRSDLYPERRGRKPQKSHLGVFLGVEEGERIARMKCEGNVYWCLRNSPLLRILQAALKASGCEFDYRRHVSCEVCHPKVSGGYDPELNQVVICQNVARKRSTVQGVLTHEMIHMVDYCQNEMDFDNVLHLACSEVRAANLAHCSFLSAWIYGNATPFNFKATHQNCVKKKALSSILAMKEISEEDAMRAIDHVFPKCYIDLEPIGRRCRRNSLEMNMASLEAPLFGYDYRI